MKSYEFTVKVRVGFSDGKGHYPHRCAQKMRRDLHAITAAYLALPADTRSTAIETKMRSL